jgi:hypothetical protein
VDFISRGPGYTLFVTPTEAVLALPSARTAEATTRKTALLRMQVVGANATAQPKGRDELPGRVNYFRGNDSARWRTGLPTYARASYEDVYPGIDLVYYGNQRQLEYDFIVGPGADPGTIALAFEGAQALEVDENGNLILQTGGGRVTQRAPRAYQEIDGVSRNIPSRYALEDTRAIGSGSFSRPTAPDRRVVRFDVGPYDHRRPLVIDPVLVYSTFLGGTGNDWAYGIAVDGAGNAYVSGFTESTDFPTTPATFEATMDGRYEAFVTKLDSSGSALIYSTYLGGTGGTLSQGIAVDGAGSAYITGYTDSIDFPTTPGAFDGTFNSLGVTYDTFVTKLEASGAALAYSTYLGGSSNDTGNGIAVDSAGSAYVTGGTNSSNFPTTVGAFDRALAGEADAFVTKLDATGSALAYSTYLGGLGGGEIFEDGRAIAVDTAGSAYVTGWTQSSDFPTTPGAFDTTLNGTFSNDAFVTKLEASGAALAYSTYLGGSTFDIGYGIAVDSAGSAYVTGATVSSDFPTTPGAFDTTQSSELLSDVFVTKLEATGAALAYSTFLGGSEDDAAFAIAVDSTGSAHVSGITGSSDYPTTPDAFDNTFHGGAYDALVTKLEPSGAALIYSTYLGGSGTDESYGIAVDSTGNAYVSGVTYSFDFPTTAAAFDSSGNSDVDAFVTKVGLGVDTDQDGDGILDPVDNCPANANPDQLDSDSDGQGNACDSDDDNDGAPDASDNCPLLANADQRDGDGDGIGDACDPNPNDGPSGDLDNDGVVNGADNCPTTANPDQLDHDHDGKGNACDPDALEMVFSSNRDGNFEIYGRRADGTEVRLTNHPSNDLEPALSPDLTKILFVSRRDGARNGRANQEIYVMNADGTGVTRLTRNATFRHFDDSSPAWSPSGLEIAFASDRTGNGDIYVMRADGSVATRLTNHSAIDGSPDWSPDGRRIAFTSSRTGNGDIYVMDRNGGPVGQLTTHPGIDLFPSWSPDSTKIAFSSSRNNNISDVYEMNANGTGLIRSTNHSAIDAQPSWGPSGKIIFISTRDGNFEIYSMNSGGSGLTRLTNNSAEDVSPHW